MRTSIDLPNDLFRRAKAEAALRGRKFRDLVEEGIRRVLKNPEEPESSQKQSPSLFQLMEDHCGIVDSGISDLASNPDHLEGFGR